MDDMLSKPLAAEKATPENPFAAKTEKSRPSEPTSRTRGDTTNRDGTVKSPDKPSVRAELKFIQERRRSDPKSDTRQITQKSRKKSNKEMEK